MTDRGPTGSERLVDLPRQSAGSASSALVRLAAASGYNVAATGPGAYRLARTRRRLVVSKRTESIVVAIFEDRTGTKARFVGDIDQLLIDHLVAEGAGPATPVPDRPGATVAPGVPTVPPPPPAQITPMPGHTGPPAAPAQAAAAQFSDTLQSPTPSFTSGPRPAPLITGAGRADHGLDAHDGVDRTAARPAHRQEADQVRLPDGRLIGLDKPILIGRNPDPARGPADAIAVSIDDRSLSKTHVLLSSQGGRIEVTDLHSTNGTSVTTEGSSLMCEPGVPLVVQGSAVVLAGTVRLVLGGTT